MCRARIRESSHEKQVPRTQVKISNVTADNARQLRGLDPCDIGRVVSLQGLVTRSSGLLPHMHTVAFECTTPDCHGKKEVKMVDYRADPDVCEVCRLEGTFSVAHNASVYRDKQCVTLQESPEEIPAGGVPQTIPLHCFDSDCATMKPGDRVQVICRRVALHCVIVFRMSCASLSSLRRFVPIRPCLRTEHYQNQIKKVVGVLCASNTRLAANQNACMSACRSYVDVLSVSTRRQEDEFAEEAEEAEMNRKFRDFAESGDVMEKLITRLAPGIRGEDRVKRGLLCQLLEGTPKASSYFGRFREQLHILLCGDPATAKSQLMTAVYELSPRGVMTSGRGTSAVGLTACVARDPDTGAPTLEPGALVLADQGICCIDEFDKMESDTRAALNEAMEDQSVSLAKGGMVCNLHTKVSVLAVANPINSRYDPDKSIIENINLPRTLTSRFDLIFLMVDRQNPKQDALLAAHVLSFYSDNSKNDTRNKPPDDSKFLRAYIQFAKRHCRPRLTEEAEKEVQTRYLHFRKDKQRGAGLFCTTRMLDSLVKLSDAHAKSRLSNEVSRKDVADAAKLLNDATFAAATDPGTGKIDMEALRTGVSLQDRFVMARAALFLAKAVDEQPRTLAEALPEVNAKLTELRHGSIGMNRLTEVSANLVKEGRHEYRGGKLYKKYDI